MYVDRKPNCESYLFTRGGARRGRVCTVTRGALATGGIRARGTTRNGPRAWRFGRAARSVTSVGRTRPGPPGGVEQELRDDER